MSRILKIYYKGLDNREYYPEKVCIYSDIGIKEDKKSSKKGRNLSFIFSDDKLKADNMKGLCTNRFKANFIISGSININIGDMLSINDSTLIVTEIGKRCFDGCHIISTDRCKCPLKNIFYCDVVKDGEIYLYSIVDSISKDKS